MTRTVLETKENDHGIWDRVSYDGKPESIWIKREDPTRQELRMPLSCKACGTFMYNRDTKYFYISGVCADCHINYIEDRNLNLHTHKERVQHCIDSIQAKKERDNS